MGISFTELDGGNGCTTSRVYLIPLNCTVKKVNMLHFSVHLSTKNKEGWRKKKGCDFSSRFWFSFSLTMA